METFVNGQTGTTIAQVAAPKPGERVRGGGLDLFSEGGTARCTRLEADQVFLDDASETFHLPAKPMPAIGLEEWLRKTAELEELAESFSGGIRAEFPERKRMQAMEAIATLQRVAPSAVVVEPGRAGNQKPAPRLVGVLQPLHEIPPTPVFVDLVEQDQGLIGGQLAPEEHLSRHMAAWPVP